MRFVFGAHELDDATFRLTCGDDVVAIEPQVFDVLVFLINHRHRVVTKEELLDNVWGDRFVSESALTSRIKSARRAVGDDGRAQKVIATVHGRGYQFIAGVTEVDAHRLGAERGSADPASPPSSSGASSGDSAFPASFGVSASGRLDISATERAERLALTVDQEFAFVGRRDALRTAEELEQRVADGHTAVLLLGGEPGIGKTRLAGESLRQAADHGFLPLGGRCDRYLATSLQPWLEALAIYVDTTDQELLEADVAGVDQHLRAVCPSLDARLRSDDRAPVQNPDEYAVIDALAVVLDRAAARRPMALVLDDVQWAGGATRALTSLLLRRGTARVLLVLTYRTTTDDLDDAARDWLGELARHANAARIDLAGLEPADIAALVAAAVTAGAGPDGTRSNLTAPGQDVGSEVFARSGGHALFATELLRDLRGGFGVDRLPRSVAELVRVRLGRLSRPVNQLVAAAAALGQEFSLEHVIAATELSSADALDALDHALGAELFHEIDGSADRFRFSHQLMPAAVLESMSGARRVRLHARLAEVLDERGASAMAVAHHLIEACPILDADEVVARVRRTAAAALVDFDYDSAAGLLARCVELPMDARKRAEVSAELGAAWNAAGRQPQALEPFDRAVRLARSNGWPDLLMAAALGRWGVSPFRASQDRTVVPLIDEALATATIADLGGVPDADRTMIARLLAKKAAFNLFSGNLAERDAVSSQAIDLVGPGATPERLEVVEARWMAIACPAMVAEVTVLDEELAPLRKELGALTSDACAPEIGMYWRGEGETLRELAVELVVDPRHRRDVDQWRMTAIDGTFAFFDGDLDRARILADKALPLGREPWGEAGLVVHGLVHLIVDVTDGVPERSVDRWRQIAASVPSDSMRATWAWLEALAGDRGEANHALDLAAPHLVRMAQNFMGGFGLVGAAEAAIALERHDLVEPLRQVLADVSKPFGPIMLGHPWAPSRAAPDVLSLLDEMAGDETAAEANARSALELYDDLGATILADTLRSRSSVARR